MQGAVFMSQNPQQGSPPPNNTLVTDFNAMEISPESNTKEKLSNQSSQSDSGIFSMDMSSRATNSEQEDNRSDCSSPERKYVCPICDTMLTSQHEFTLHIRSHNNESEMQDNDKGFICRICNKILSSSSSLDRHVLVHSGERPFHCKYCGDTFTTNGNMHRHMRTHTHKSENYESDSSSDSSKSIEYNNNNVNLKKRKYEDNGIDQPNKKTDSSSDGESQQSYKCPVCERNDFDSMAFLETHLEDNHPDYPAKCNHCQQIFQNSKLLVIHRNNVHDNVNTVNTKPILQGFKHLTFVDFSSNKFKHIARHECEKNLHKVSAGLKFQCKKCSRAFPCASSLEIHENDCVLNSESNVGLDLSQTSKISENEIRRNEFFSRLNLQDNSPEKVASPPIHLSETSVKLRQQLLAKAMTLDSTKDLADIQSIISMTTNGSLLQQLQAKSELNLHQKIDSSHELVRPEQEEESQDLFAVEFRKMKMRGEFPCRLCTAVFPNLRALKGHNRTHLNGNTNGMYRCNMCPHSSVDKAALIRHMRTHNGDRPYECSLCNYAFTTKANCERHLRNRHAKTTREEVKKSIIYHPSEDPTNEDLNKLAAREELKKAPTSNDSLSDTTPEKLHSATPKLLEIRNIIPDINKSDITPLIPNILKETLNVPLVKEQPKIFSNITDIIRSENLKSLKEHRMQSDTQLPPYLHPPYNFSPKSTNVSTPHNLLSKIHVKNLEELTDTHYETQSEGENNEHYDEPIDLSKKRDEEPKNEPLPEDLSKKSPTISSQLNMGEIFAQQLLKTPPKIDPAAFYATQLALYRNTFPGFSNWPNFPISPLLFQSLQNPVLPSDSPDIKERLQRIQMCGGSMINDNFTERLKNLQNFHDPSVYNNFKVNEELKTGNAFTPISKKSEDIKPLSLNVDTSFNENFPKLQSPIHQTQPKQELVQSPNSVKMVIKNGVLMPKQKQRRYRTERPFTCEHCSARFTLRSNMERHIKQQHPQYWSQRQRGLNTPGRKSQIGMKINYCDLSIPNYEIPKTQDYDDTKEQIEDKLKSALLAQHIRANHSNQDIKRDDDDDCALIIDENADKDKTEESNQKNSFERTRIFEERLRELREKQIRTDSNKIKNEENQDLVPVSRLLDNASQQPFKDYFKREEPEVGGASEEDEEGLVASASTSEGNASGADENRSESEATAVPAKKKSAYSMAPNRVSCPYCSRKFPWSSSLRRHILTHTGQKPFKCSHCPLLFTTKSNCDRHLLRKHGNNATTISNDVANNNTNYLMRNVPERPFKCSDCPSSTFSTYSNLRKHISCKHSTQGEDMKAQGYEAGSSEDEKIINNELKNDCENHIDKPNEIQNVSVQNSDLPFKCHLCEGSFSERQEALDHLRNKHSSEYELLISKNILENSPMYKDEDGHHEEEENDMRGKFPDYSNRKVICAFCLRRFWSAEDLRRHMRTHTGERPFSCDICKRKFTLKHSMLRHRKKHNVNYDNENLNSDEDGNNIPPTFESFMINENNNGQKQGERTEESDGNEGSDLISKLLGIRDRGFIDRVLTASADDAAKLLGVKNGVKE